MWVWDWCQQAVFLPQQSNYSNVVIKEGTEPENFFWVALGGKADYEHVSVCVCVWGGGGGGGGI